MSVYAFIRGGEVNEEPNSKYKYSKNVPKPFPIKKKDGAYQAGYTLQDNLVRTSAILINGTEKCPSKGIRNDMRLGERKFFISGNCGPESLDGCNGEPRHIIVNNLPSGNFDRNTDYTSDQNGKNAGLIPSIIEDIFELNPFSIARALNGTNNQIHGRCHRIDFEEKQFVKGKTKSGNETRTTMHKGICTPIPVDEEASEDAFTNYFPSMSNGVSNISKIAKATKATKAAIKIVLFIVFIIVFLVIISRSCVFCKIF